MAPEQQIDKLFHRMLNELRIAGIGAVTLAASLDISMLNTNIAKYTSISGAAVFAVGATLTAIDYHRFNNISGFYPDDPDGEFVEVEADILELPTASTELKSNKLEAA